MATINFLDFFNEQEGFLSIPPGIAELSVKNAAKAYAQCGWYVLPVTPGSKNPGSYVGKGWPDKSTRDLDEIESLFGDRDLSIALHVGKSGALVIDVDDASQLPKALNDELAKDEVPFQSTRLIEDKRRGHYFYSLPKGVHFGNGTGGLEGNWGDVRGNNGVVIVAPSAHIAEGGFYSWKRTGVLPTIPDAIRYCLIPGENVGVRAASKSEVIDFISSHQKNLEPSILGVRIKQLHEFLERDSRHMSFLKFVVSILNDAKLDFYDAGDALNQAQALFNFTKPVNEQTPYEFEGLVHWAVAQVEATSPEKLVMHGFMAAPHLQDHLIAWFARNVEDKA